MNVIKPKTRKKAESKLLEWKVAEDEESWQTFTEPMSPLSKPSRPWHLRGWVILGCVLLMLLAGSGWLWQQSQAGLAQVKQEVEAAVQVDLWRTASTAPTLQTAHTPLPRDVAQLQVVDLGQDWAMVEAILREGERSYRQTRVYRQNEHGWYRAMPSAALWGTPATLETNYFVIHYFAHDAEAVQEAAHTLDELVPDLVASYVLDSSLHPKWGVWVSPEQRLADSRQETASNAPIFVTSPAISLTPTSIREGDLLAQAILLEVIDSLSKEVVTLQIPESLRGSQKAVQLESLLYSLRLWEVWSHDLPLATLHKPIVQWIYSDLASTERALPKFDAALCDLHRLWEAAPYMVRVPLFCGDAKQIDHEQIWRYLQRSRVRLADLSLFTAATPAQPLGDLATVVGVATVLDYVATHYGRDKIATLVAATPHYASWESLIHAALGVSMADFEAGWQAHLETRYGITLVFR